MKGVYCDSFGRMCLVNTLHGDKCISFFNIYAPNNCKERVQFFKKIEKWICVPNENELILGGDFNCVLNYKYGQERGIKKFRRDASIINDLCKKKLLTDI